MGFPWHWPAGASSDEPVSLRLIARKTRFAHRPRWQRAVVGALTTALWPLGAFEETLRVAWQRDRAGLPPHGGAFRGALRCFAVALRHNVPPWEYYAYEFWRPEALADVDAFIYESERPGLISALNRIPDPDPINDKLAFHEFGESAGLPLPTLLAYWQEGASVVEFERAGAWWETALWLKPRRGSRSQGQEAWRHKPEGGGGVAPDSGRQESLFRHLSTRSRRSPVLVQARLGNHPDVAPLTNGALAAVRLITGRRRDGSVVLIDALACLPSGGEIASTGTGGIVSSVDLDDGRLRDAYRFTPARESVERHPDTGARIAGARLPDWAQALAHVTAAHTLLPGFVLLGWDVAFTPAGPVLIEGNSGWGCFVHQAIWQPPRALGRTILAEVVRDHLS
jgi:hypothetical protein